MMRSLSVATLETWTGNYLLPDYINFMSPAGGATSLFNVPGIQGLFIDVGLTGPLTSGSIFSTYVLDFENNNTFSLISQTTFTVPNNSATGYRIRFLIMQPWQNNDISNVNTDVYNTANADINNLKNNSTSILTPKFYRSLIKSNSLIPTQFKVMFSDTTGGVGSLRINSYTLRAIM